MTLRGKSLIQRISNTSDSGAACIQYCTSQMLSFGGRYLSRSSQRRRKVVIACILLLVVWLMYINFPSEETGLPRESRSAEGERHAEHVSDEDNRVLTEPAKRLSDEDQVLDLLQPAKGLSRTDKPKVLHKVDPGLIGVWPVPQQVFASEPLESPVTVSAELQFLAESEGKDLKTLIQHYRGVYLEARANSKLDSSCGSSLFTIKSLAVTIYGRDDVLSLDTDYSYTLTIDASKSVQVTIVAATVYGVRYGLETFLQLFNGQCLRYSNLRIKDRPDYRHRGFMLDTGRRFMPKTLLLNFLDAMSMVKLNVFHWHLSDWCLFSIESKLFPELNSCNEEARCYTVQEVWEVVKYARIRGIRVIPEIDIPGHAKGLQQLTRYNMQFCDGSNRQIYNDPQGQTIHVLKKLVEELMELFPDKYFHIGCDETSAVNKCNLDNIRQLEEEIARFLISKGKIPIGWEEALFTTGVKIDNLVIQAWLSHSATEAATKGYKAIESNIAHFYLDYVERDLWTVWSGPIGSDSDDSLLKSRILGGEFAMWGDMWIKNRQCWDEPNWQALPRAPLAHWMHDKNHDEVFMDSMAGLVWPRGIAAAGRFWKYSKQIDRHGLQERIDRQNKFMIARGVNSCPVGCTCDYLSRCNRRYPR